MRIITSQLAHRTGHGKKRVPVSDVPEARGIMGDAIMMVYEQNAFSRYGLNDPRQAPSASRWARSQAVSPWHLHR